MNNMRHIASKVLYQAKYDGFIRFVDGNRMNYFRNNIESICFKEAFNSIGTRNITDWDANLNSSERLNVLLKKPEFDDAMAKILSENGDFQIIKCLNIHSNVTFPQDFSYNPCEKDCRNLCSKTTVEYERKTCNRDIFLL
jgi:hypothetical protein